MYVVRDKATKEILHINPAPLSQKLEGTEVYFRFDPRKMEIGKLEGLSLPDRFEINKKGEIVEPSLEEKVKAGEVKLAPDQKIQDGKVVQKSLSELVAQGLISLGRRRKVAGEGEAEHIADKSLSELIEEGLVSIEPHQKIEGEKIVDKTTQELLDEGLCTREEVLHLAITRLRGEVTTQFQQNRTPRGYQLDDLARQKASFSAPFRHLSETDERKKELLGSGLIYPDEILDEILDEVAKIQSAYRAAKKAVITAFDKGQPVAKWASVSLQDHLPGAKKKIAPKKTTARKRAASKKKPATKKTPKRGS